MILAWARLFSQSIGVAAIAVAAQVGAGQALGIIRWDGSFDGVDGPGWSALITWVAFVYAVAVVAGALVGRRAVRGTHRTDGIGARIAATFASAIGAGAAVVVAWLPARGVRAPLGVNPGLVVTITAAMGIVAGMVIALAALSAPPVAGGFRATVAWVWVLGAGSAAAGLATHEPFAAPRVAMLDAPSLVPAQWWSGPALMIVVAALIGAAVAGLARWAGAGRLGVALSGAAGPAVVAFAYLVAGPGDTDAQLGPYRASLAAIAAGLLVSIVVAIPWGARASASLASSASSASAASSSSSSSALDAPPAPPPSAFRDPAEAVDGPASATGDRATEPAPAPAATSRPAFASVPVTVSAAASGTVYASESRPQPAIGRPPKGYEEYSEWLKDLSGATDPRPTSDTS